MLSRISRLSNAVDLAEEAVMEDPEAADHREADREGERSLHAVPRASCQSRSPGRPGSIPRFSTSSVIAIAKTPSLKATIRENSISFSLRCFAVLPFAHPPIFGRRATERRTDRS